MDTTRFKALFGAIEKATFEKYIKFIVEPLPKDKRELLIVDNVSFTIGRGTEWFSAKFYLRPFCHDEGDPTFDEEDRWIRADVIYYDERTIESYCAKEQGHLFHSLEACIDYYFAD